MRLFHAWIGYVEVEHICRSFGVVPFYKEMDDIDFDFRPS